ncbi:MAG: GGDEF domain-containing protein [Candidatus Omnitrophota bacterium]
MKGSTWPRGRVETRFVVKMDFFIYSILSIAVLFVSYSTLLKRALALSISMSIIILLKESGGISFQDFLGILFINIMPFLAFYFKKIMEGEKLIVKDRFNNIKKRYEDLEVKDRDLLRSNLDKERKLQKLLSLYEVSKDMSSSLSFDDIFDIFSYTLKKLFRFKTSRLILLKEGHDIASIHEIDVGQDITKPVETDFDREIRDIMLEDKSARSIALSDNNALSRRLSVARDFEPLTSIPLFVEQSLGGIFYIEGLPDVYYENFLILMSQFAIQFQKVMLYKKIEDISITDSLTGVSTRRYLLERFTEEIHRSMRHKVNLSCMMLDIDHFKKINDKYGHLVGDVVLKNVASILKISLREVDLIGRYGGEEFIAVFSATHKDMAFQVAERIRESIEGLVLKAYDETISITVSMGISVFPDDGVSIEDLIESADKALYKAKETGRNRVC